MAVGVDIDTKANPWVVTYNGSTASHTLPFTVWPVSQGDFLVKRLVWVATTAAGGNTVLLDNQIPSPNGPSHLARFVATGADFEPAQEWKRDKQEGAPHGLVITTFDAGELYIHF